MRAASRRSSIWTLAVALVAVAAIFVLRRHPDDQTSGAKPPSSTSPRKDESRDSESPNASGKRRTVSENFQAPLGPYRNVLPNLAHDAHSGNAQAAYSLARLLLDCLGVSRGRSLGYGSDDPKRCEGVDVSDSKEAIRYLGFAAEHGIREAQLLYSVAALDSMTPSEMIADPARVQDYKQRSMQYLTIAALDGSGDAMLKLSNFYSDGIMTPQDPVMAYAYEYAAEKAHPEWMGGTSRLDLLAKGMSSEELGRAQASGNSILDRCCRRSG